jgi:deoxyuridine 5'-triphosphate nucleotidohydrolase
MSSTVKCANCSKEFVVPPFRLRNKVITCSKKCMAVLSSARLSEKIEVSCLICENNIKVKPSRVKRFKTCSALCKYEYYSRKYLGRNNPNTKYTSLDDTFFKEIDTKEKAYLLGWIASDGHVSETGFHITIHTRDIDIFGTFDKILGITNKIQRRLLSDIVTYSVSSKQMKDDLFRWLKLPFNENSSHKKSHIVKFPELLSDDLKMMFLRGFFDGDGSINDPRKSGRIPAASVGCCSKDMISSIRDFVLTPLSADYIDREMFVLNWDGVNALDFLSNLYADGEIYGYTTTGERYNLFLSRKYDLYLSWLAWRPALPGYWRVDSAIWVKTRPDAIIPKKSRESDVGYDLTCTHIVKKIGNLVIYGTGLKVRPPFGYYFDLVPRSSIIKTGYIQANSIGVIDPSYTGEIMVALARMDESVPDLQLPIRIGQLIAREIIRVKFEYVSSLDDLGKTQRNDGGFGSTGV